MIVAFKFSVACTWCVLIKEDKDNSLQFAKVFLQILKVTNSPKFSPPPFCTIRYYIPGNP